MKIASFFIMAFAMCIGFAQDRPQYVTVHKTMKLMGCRFDITVVAETREMGYINIEEAAAEIRRVERMISSWDPESETSLINEHAGIRPVRVSEELFQLIERAKQISEITDGAFDISYASMDPVWRFDGTMQQMPTSEEIARSVAKIGYRKIIMDKEEHTIFLKEKGMKIGFGAIGKGYAADRAKELLVSKQVVAGIINASGDLTTWGTKATGEKWLVGIVNPLNKDKIVSWLPVLESSVATSGDYEKFITFKGKQYSHIIDPRSGYPVTGVHSVSVFAKQAELCDALATAIFVMGTNSGLALINQLGGTEAVIFDSDNKIHKSSGVMLDFQP